MKRNRIFTILAVLSAVLFVSATAHAGSGEAVLAGIAVGVGAAIVGTAIAGSVHHHTSYIHSGPVYSSTCRPQYEIRRIWVDPVFDTVWNPPHYDPNGYWVEGSYIQVEVRPGYWRKQKIYVGCRPVVHHNAGFSLHIGGHGHHPQGHHPQGYHPPQNHGHHSQGYPPPQPQGYHPPPSSGPSGHHSPNVSGGGSSIRSAGFNSNRRVPNYGNYDR